MTWVQLLSIVAYQLARRFGYLGLAFDGAVRLAGPTGESPVVPAAAFAAPDELKRLVVEYLDRLADGIPQPFVRLVVRRGIDALPAVLDQVWDTLFARQMVGAASADLPPRPVAVVLPADLSKPDANLLEAMRAGCGC